MYNVDVSFFSRLNPETAYWAGFMAADGNVYINPKFPSKGQLVLALSNKDIDHIKMFKTAISAEQPIEDVKRSNTSRLRICRMEMVRDLADWGVVPCKGTNMIWPDLPDGLKCHFLRGYFDGDGSISLAKRSYNKSRTYLDVRVLGTEAFLLKIREMFVEHYGKDVGYLRDHNKSTRPSNVWELRFVTKSAEAFCHWIYRDSTRYTRLDRKYQRYIDYTSR